MCRITTRLSLFIPFGVLLFADAGLTLYFQPTAFWDDHSLFRESNPLFAKTLEIGPMAFLGAIGLHLLLWTKSA